MATDRILEFRTNQTGVLKQLFDRIGTVVSECCFVFTPPDKDYNENEIEVIENDVKIEEEIVIEPPKKGRARKKNVGKEEVIEEVLTDKGTRRRKNAKTESKKEKKRGRKSTIQENYKDENRMNFSSGGLRICKITEDGNILIKVVLFSDCFDFYSCLEEKITAGMDMTFLNNALKSVNDNSQLTVYMNASDRGKLIIHAEPIDDDNNGEETDIELILMDSNDKDVDLKPQEFIRSTISSDKFNEICKSLNNNSSQIEICSCKNQIIFSGKCDAGKITKSFKDTTVTTGNDKIFQAVYDLKNVMYFSKCNKMCDYVQIFTATDYPLTLLIQVGNLGKMYVFICPHQEPDNDKNYN